VEALWLLGNDTDGAITDTGMIVVLPSVIDTMHGPQKATETNVIKAHRMQRS